DLLVGAVGLSHPRALDTTREPLVIELLGADGTCILDSEDRLVVIRDRNADIVAQRAAERADNISYFFWHPSSLPDKSAGVLQDFDCSHNPCVCSNFNVSRESLETGLARGERICRDNPVCPGAHGDMGKARDKVFAGLNSL